MIPKRIARAVLDVVLPFVPLDGLLLLQQRLGSATAALLFYRDWRLEVRGRPKFFKHHVNLARWRSEPARWPFTARGVYARELMFRGCSVLDLCCGDGFHSRLFFSDIAGTVVAIDRDAYALAYASYYNAAPTITYHEVDIVKEPLPGGRFDVVVWNAAICYFDPTEIDTILGKICRAGRPGMKLCGMLPKARGYVDHKTEFEDTASVRRLLERFFGVVTVREVDEVSTITFYFQASSPLDSAALHATR